MSSQRTLPFLAVATIAVTGTILVAVVTEPAATPISSDSPPTISGTVKSANELHPTTIYAGLQVYYTLRVDDDHGVAFWTNSVPGQPDRTPYNCMSGPPTCYFPTAGETDGYMVPPTPGTYAIIAKATDTAGQTQTYTLTFTAVGCSSDAECGGTYFLSSGDISCGVLGDSLYRKITKDQSASVCESGSCQEKIRPGVFQDCGPEKVCTIQREHPNVAVCVAQPPACAPNAPVPSSGCTCGVMTYGYDGEYFVNTLGYCCLGDAGYFHTRPGPCPAPTPLSPAPSSRTATSALLVAPAVSSLPVITTSASSLATSVPQSPSTVVTTPSSLTTFSIPSTPQAPNSSAVRVKQAEHPNAQVESSSLENQVSKATIRVLKKRQQALRRELRSLERFLFRKKNIAVLGQVADLRDALSELDFHDPSVAKTLRGLQEEVADLRRAVTKKAKHGG